MTRLKKGAVQGLQPANEGERDDDEGEDDDYDSASQLVAHS